MSFNAHGIFSNKVADNAQLQVPRFVLEKRVLIRQGEIAESYFLDYFTLILFDIFKNIPSNALEDLQMCLRNIKLIYEFSSSLIMEKLMVTITKIINKALNDRHLRIFTAFVNTSRL